MQQLAIITSKVTSSGSRVFCSHYSRISAGRPLTAGTQLRLLSVSIITRWNIDFFREGLKFHNHGDTKKAPTRAFSCGWKCLLAHDHKERDGWLQESMLTNQLLVLIVSIITRSPVRWNMKGWIWKRWKLLISLKCKNYFVPLTCLKPILCCWLDFWRYVSREIWRKHWVVHLAATRVAAALLH